MKSIVITLLIAVLIFFIFDKSKYVGNTTIVVTDTVYSTDTIVKIKKGKDIPFEIYRVLEDSIFIHDTIQVLSDYYATRVYSDTITQDSSKFYIQDSIFQNKILSRRFQAEIAYKTIYQTNTIYQQEKNAIYLGFLGDLRRFDNKVGLGVGLGYYMPKKGLILFNASTNQYSLGFYKKF